MFTEKGGPGGPPATVPGLSGRVRGAVGEGLGLAWGGGVWALRLLVQFEEHLLLPLLLVQILFQSLEGRWSSARSAGHGTPTKASSGNFPPRPQCSGPWVFPLFLRIACHPPPPPSCHGLAGSRWPRGAEAYLRAGKQPKAGNGAVWQQGEQTRARCRVPPQGPPLRTAPWSPVHTTRAITPPPRLCA